jgi:hypothetical protein
MRNSVFLSRRAEKFLAGLRDANLYSRLRAANDYHGNNARLPPWLAVALAKAAGAVAIAPRDRELFSGKGSTGSRIRLNFERQTMIVAHARAGDLN